MFSNSEYLWGWVLYGAASLGLIIVFWFMTRWVKFQVVRNTLRVIVAAALLMPYPVDSESNFLAPAMIMTFIEGLFIKDAGYARAGIPLLITIVSAMVIYILLSIIWKMFWDKRKNHSSLNDDNVHSESAS